MNEHVQTGTAPDRDGGPRPARDKEDAPSTVTAQRAPPPTFLQRLAGLFRLRNGSSLRKDLADALSVSEGDTASFSAGERAMLHNILRLREVRVEDVMIPRADIEAVEITTTLGDLLTTFEKSGHSRMPVYGETLDDPRGMVHIRDVVAQVTRLARQKRGRGGKAAEPGRLDLSKVDLSKTVSELNLLRAILFVPPSMLASDLMARMQAQRIQMALVIDEYGGTDGIVSLEDIVEMVVGDIEDEHDDEEVLVTQTGDGIYVVDGKAEIDEVASLIGEGFMADEHAEDVDTIGGMIFNTLGRIPVRGEVVQAIPGFEFHVLDADPRRVKRVRIIASRGGDRRRRVARAPATEPPQP